jgi:hypothetical protein
MDRSKIRTQQGELRLMKNWMTPRTFEYIAAERVQELVANANFAEIRATFGAVYFDAKPIWSNLPDQ